jgi:manganese transport protein
MPKMIDLRKGLGSVLLWSVISAAFIGPGTVTTAARAGADYNLQLLWALVFATLAAIVVQEAAARVTLASGKGLGEILALRYAEKGRKWCVILFFSVAFGCAAYQAGNILGAVAGLKLLFNAPAQILALAVTIPAALLLWNGRHGFIARVLGGVVFLMGFAFIGSALGANSEPGLLIEGAFIPSVPSGSLLLIMGLVGTTIVPYNLFLASGLGQGQSVAEMRLGLILAVCVGGIISMAILVTGSGVEGEFSYGAVGSALSRQMGSWGSVLFGAGLFAAGATSAITAPLAAAMTARSLLGNRAGWSELWFKVVWMVVLGIGLIFGLLDIRPIPAIILAQAINGILLPLITAFLMLAVNDRRLLPEAYANGIRGNIFLIVVFAVVCMLGLQNIWKSLVALFSPLKLWAEAALWSQLIITGLLLVILLRKILKKGNLR